MRPVPSFAASLSLRLCAPRISLSAVAARTKNGKRKMSTATAAVPKSGDEDLVQYVVVRSDLDWPMGSVIAQGIHAAIRATHPADDAHTAAYVSPSAPGQMTTIVVSAKDEGVLHTTAARLDAAGVRYALWTEQPEGIATALASRPGPRAALKPLFKGLRLMR